MNSETKTFVLDSLKDEQDVGKIRAMLVIQHDLNENAARQLVRECLTELGISSDTKRTNWEAVVRTIRENPGLKRSELKILVSDESGCTLSSAGHYISMIEMCKEWHRQES